MIHCQPLSKYHGSKAHTGMDRESAHQLQLNTLKSNVILYPTVWVATGELISCPIHENGPLYMVYLAFFAFEYIQPHTLGRELLQY